MIATKKINDKSKQSHPPKTSASNKSSTPLYQKNHPTSNPYQNNSNKSKLSKKNDIQKTKKSRSIKSSKISTKRSNHSNISKKNKNSSQERENLSKTLDDEEKKELNKNESISQNYNQKEINPNIDFTSNVISEKRTKDSLARLLTVSQGLLDQQNDILNQCDFLTKRVLTNEYEIDRIEKREFEKDDFPENIKNYSDKLQSVLVNFKQRSKDIEHSNVIKNENNSLKYRMEMMNIDKNDNVRELETELVSIKTVYSNEINSMINFLKEIGYDNLPFDKVFVENITNDKVMGFFGFLKRVIKEMKENIIDQNNQIDKLVNEFNDKNNKLETFNKNIEEFNNRNNLEYKQKMDNFINSMNNNTNNSRLQNIDDILQSNNNEIKNNISNNNKPQLNKNKEEDLKQSQSNIDNFQRSKMINQNNNTTNINNNISSIGNNLNSYNNQNKIFTKYSLDHDYSDPHYFQDSYLNKVNDSNLNNLSRSEVYQQPINRNINNNAFPSNNLNMNYPSRTFMEGNSIGNRNLISQINRSQNMNTFI